MRKMDGGEEGMRVLFWNVAGETRIKSSRKA